MFWEDDSEPHARSGKLGSRRGLRKLFKCQGINTEIVPHGGVERLDSRIGAEEDLLNLVSEPQQWFRDVLVHRCIPHT